MTAKKQDIITFKVDRKLAERMKHIENRSDFIRHAVLAALDDTCPLCAGTGVMTDSQKRFWNEFMKTHEVVTEPREGSRHIVCRKESVRK